MKTNIKVTNYTLSIEAADYLGKRLESIEKFVAGDAGAAIMDVEVGRPSEHHRTGEVYRAEFTLHAAGKHYRSEATEADLLAAIDVARDKLVEELRTSSKKRLDIIRRGAARAKDMLRGLWRK